MNNIVKTGTEHVERYEYSKTKLETEKFFWHTLCDNYLEFVKDRIYNPSTYGQDAAISAKYTLYTSMLAVLKLMAPIMPYITEAVYQLKFSALEGVKSVHLSSWPVADKKCIDAKSEKAGDLMVAVVDVVRRTKSKAQVSLKTPVKQLTISCSAEDRAALSTLLEDLKAVIYAEKIAFGPGAEIQCGDCEVKVNVAL